MIYSSMPMNKMVLNTIVPGDCGSLMSPMLEADSIDLIMTSPPYADKRKDTYGGVPAKDYVNWFLPIAESMKDVIKPTGSIVIVIREGYDKGEMETYVLDLILAMIRKVGLRWSEQFIWHKTTCVPRSPKRRLKNGWERCLHFTKTKDFKFRPDTVMEDVAESTRKRAKTLSKNDMKRRNSVTGSNIGKSGYQMYNMEKVYPSNVLVGTIAGHEREHPAVFPNWIPNWFIRLLTDEGDTVLDPFAGTGTTCVEAKSLGRNWIGIEINEAYVKLAQRNTRQLELV